MKDMMKFTYLVALGFYFFIGCFDSAMPINPQCAEAVEAETVECDIDLNSVYEDVSDLAQQLEQSEARNAELQAENEKLTTDNYDLKQIIAVKNWTIGKKAWRECEVWITDAMIPGDLQIIEPEECDL